MDLRPELGSGPLHAPLWLIGESWGAEEAGLRQPFVGQAGTLLSAALREAGLQRADVRLDTLAPAMRPDDAAWAWGAERLNALIAAHRPKVIVGFGERVCAHLVGAAWPDDGIQKLRGYLWDAPCGRVLGSVAPQDILTSWTPWRPLLTMDLRKARDEVALGAPPLTQRDVTIVTREADLPDLLRAAMRAPLLSVDIENTQDLQLACVGFAPTPERAWVIPAHTPWQLDAIRALCESGVPKVLQNGQYDRFFLKRFARIVLRAQAFDTQLAWHALNPELAGKKTEVGYRKAGGRRTAKSLAFLASIYLRTPWWKSYNFSSDDAQYILCGHDVCNTLEIAQKMTHQLDAA